MICIETGKIIKNNEPFYSVRVGLRDKYGRITLSNSQVYLSAEAVNSRIGFKEEYDKGKEIKEDLFYVISKVSAVPFDISEDDQSGIKLMGIFPNSLEDIIKTDTKYFSRELIESRLLRTHSLLSQLSHRIKNWMEPKGREYQPAEWADKVYNRISVNDLCSKLKIMFVH